MNKRLLILIILALGITAFVVACGDDTTTTTAGGTETTAGGTETTAGGAETTAGGAGEPYGTLRVGFSDLGAENFDPTSVADARPWFQVYEPLVRLDKDGNFGGWLAESFSMSEDGMYWTFNLRKDAKWSNGDPFTSADVKFSLERMIDPAAQNAWAYSQRDAVASVEAIDDYTVKVNLKAPQVFYPDSLQGVWMTSKKYFDEVGAEGFTKAPIGTGPWVLTKYESGSSCEFEVNKNYWGKKPVWEKMVFLMVPEETTRIAMLKRGELDITNVSIDNAVALRDDGYELRETHLLITPGVFLNGYWTNDGATSDVRVREAMDISIDRDEIANTFFEGFALPKVGLISHTEGSWGFNPIWYSSTYDTERAKQLLAEAGYPDNFADPVVRVYAVQQAQFTWQPDLMAILAGYWSAVGIQTEVIPMDHTAMREGWVNGELDGGVTMWVGNSAATSMAAFQNHYTSKGMNRTGNDPEFDKLFFSMLSELNDAKRMEIWQTVQEKAFKNYSILGICRLRDQYAVSDQIGAWEGVDWTDWGFEIGLAGVQHR